MGFFRFYKIQRIDCKLALIDLSVEICFPIEKNLFVAFLLWTFCIPIDFRNQDQHLPFQHQYFREDNRRHRHCKKHAVNARNFEWKYLRKYLSLEFSGGSGSRTEYL